MIPDYNSIYHDILNLKYPHKKDAFHFLTENEKFSAIDVLELNKVIFGNNGIKKNQKYRSYNKSDIFKILNYQKQHKCNNSQLATYFNMSRNTITKWRKIFLV